MTPVSTAADMPKTRRPISWVTLYGEPLLLVLACVSVALVFNTVLRPVETNKADFYTFWDSGRAYLQGLDLYFGIPLRPDAGYNLNAPAVTVLLFAAAALLPLRLSLFLVTVINVALFLLASRSIARAIGVSERWGPIASLLLTSQATFLAMQLGQPVALLLVLLTAAWKADRSDRPMTAGFLLGVAMFAKPFLGLFLPYFAWRQSWRLLAALAAGGLAMAAFGLLVAGVPAHLSWLKVLGAISWEAHFANASFLGTLSRLLTLKPSGMYVTPPAIADALVRPIWIVLALAAVALAARCIARGPRVDRDWSLLLLLALLVSPLGWVYYVPLAAGPLMATYLRAPRAAQWLAAAGYLCLCIPPTILIEREMGPLTATTLGSVYGWGVLALWGSALMQPAMVAAPALETPAESNLDSL